MVKLKLFLAFFLGIGLYGFMSYYQPITESYAASTEANQEVLVQPPAYLSPIPEELHLSLR